MAGSTEIKSGSIATIEVKVAGSSIPSDYEIISIEVFQGINRIPSATIVLKDGDASTGDFKVSSSDTFLPGKDIVIEAGYDSTNKQIFKGMITKQSLRVNEFEGSNLFVECRDAAIKMTVGRKSASFSKKKDSDIITSIIGNYSGLSSDVTATDTEWPEQIQYYCSDWDFMLSRAETNGLIVNAINGKVSVVKADADTSSVLTLAYGDNILSFDADLDSVSQIASAKASSWDYKTQKVINATSNTSKTGPGNLSSKKLSDVVGLSDFLLQTPAALTSDELTTWTKSQIDKSAYAKIIGTLKCQGTALLLPAKYFTLKGMGARFNGDHIIGTVRHEIANGNWTTEVGMGLSADWFIEEEDVIAPSAAALLPAAKGLFQGTVKKINDDPDSQYRVQIDIPIFDASGEGVWARLSTFYASSSAGAFFIPEVGDEVIVSFLNEDPRFPIILGSLYSSSNNKPFQDLTPDEKNSKKAIATKSGVFIEFNDEDKVLTLSTPGKNKVTFDDKNKNIVLEDQNSNKVTLSDSGISLKSPKNISIESDQKVSIKGNQGVSIEASGGDTELKGMNVKATAQTQLSLEGSATASMKGGAELKLNAAMIMIN